MKNNKKGFIAISIIYSFFILFITVMLLIMYSFINDRKISNKVKSDLINDLINKAPDITISQNGSRLPNLSYNVDVKILDGGNGVSSAKYIWSTSPNGTPNIDLPSYNETLTTPSEYGIYYLIVKACDINLNCKTVVTNSFNVSEQLLCKRATSLHTETCKNSDNNNYCLKNGHEENGSITYGTLGINAVNNVGDAYDCDINGDGVYNPVNERFYYISDYYNTSTNKYDSTIASLIYYTNVHSGTANNTYTNAYTTSNDYVPTTAYNELPSASQWSNVELKNEERTITSESGYDMAIAYDYTGDVQEFTVPQTGTYTIQAWGASGGHAICNDNVCGTPGKGGYAAGIISLNAGDKLYIYVGEKGADAVAGQDMPASFNGGGSATYDHNDNESGGAGGGATDIRLVSGNWDDAESLSSRIMVAGGGGGVAWDTTGGSGGGISGTDGTATTGATQTTGYQFGIGKNGSGNGYDSRGTAGGGGGYWGGMNNVTANSGAAGGSGYISGHAGCIAINSVSDTSIKEGCSSSSTNQSCSIHYSLNEFRNTILTAGNLVMPNKNNDGTMIGNEGNGYVKITLNSAASGTSTSNQFTYTSKTARMLNYRELKQCLTTRQSATDNDLIVTIGTLNPECSFLLENTKFTNSNYAEGYFIENPYTQNNDYIWTIKSSNWSVYGGIDKAVINKYGVRPVIEVDKYKMEI